MKGFEREEKQLSEQTYHSPIFLPFKSFQRVLKGVVVQLAENYRVF